MGGGSGSVGHVLKQCDNLSLDAQRPGKLDTAACLLWKGGRQRKTGESLVSEGYLAYYTQW